MNTVLFMVLFSSAPLTWDDEPGNQKELQEKIQAEQREKEQIQQEELKRHLKELEEQLERQKNHEKESREHAERMRREAEDIRAHLKKQGRGEKEVQLSGVKAEIEELRRRAAAAKEAGRQDEANELMKKAEGVKNSMKKAPPREKEGEDPAMVIVDQISKIRKEAIRLKRDGNDEKAKRVWSEAERLEEKLQIELGEPKKERFKEKLSKDELSKEKLSKEKLSKEKLSKDERERREEKEIKKDNELWNEIERLRAEVKELRTLLKGALEKD